MLMALLVLITFVYSWVCAWVSLIAYIEREYVFMYLAIFFNLLWLSGVIIYAIGKG